jgi:HNH endonuclease
MLPLDPAKHEEYRAKIRAGRALQQAPWPIGSKKSDETRARMSAGCKASSEHRTKHQQGAKNTNYGNGKWLDKNGYVYLSNNGKMELEHRVIMARIIGRQLLTEETVHHKNGNRSDNREDNLELWSSRNPKGQRIPDKLKYAREILSLYGGSVYDQDWLD